MSGRAAFGASAAQDWAERRTIATKRQTRMRARLDLVFMVWIIHFRVWVENIRVMQSRSPSPHAHQHTKDAECQRNPKQSTMQARLANRLCESRKALRTCRSGIDVCDSARI